MPSQNPKHIKRQVLYTRKHEYKSAPPQLKYVLMGLIAVVVITSVVLLAIYLPQANPNNNGEDVIIESGDWIKMEYRLWADSDEDGVIDYLKEIPFDDSFDLPGDVWQVQVTSSSIPILGWYNNVLGMKNGTTKYITIPAAVDENPKDGIDDNTGQPVQTYTTGEHAYQKLLIKVRIVEIIKEEDWNLNSAGVDFFVSTKISMIVEFTLFQRIKIRFY